MWPRLRLLHELLADTGSIWVTADDNEVHRLKLILDEIFGQEHFLANIVWQSKDTPGNNSSDIAETHNHIIAFRKSSYFSPSLLERNEDQIANYTNPDNDSRGDWLAAPLTRAEHRERDYYELENLAGRKVFPPKGSSWRRPPTKMKWLQRDNRIWWPKTAGRSRSNFRSCRSLDLLAQHRRLSIRSPIPGYGPWGGDELSRVRVRQANSCWRRLYIAR